jgi:TPP-dependent 2-oxoacid decarboxylase
MLKHYKQPIYIELPRDIADQPLRYDVYRQGTPVEVATDEENLEEAFSEVQTWIQQSKNQ